MNADLEATLEEGRRRMRQFEEKTANQLDLFDKEVDNSHIRLGHKFSSLTEDLKPVSAPLWGVILESSSGNRIYAQSAPFDVILKFPRKCPSRYGLDGRISSARPLSSYVPDSLPYDDYWNMHKEIEPFEPSIESKTIIEGRKWRINKYNHDESYVSNPPYGIIMKKPNEASALKEAKNKRIL